MKKILMFVNIVLIAAVVFIAVTRFGSTVSWSDWKMPKFENYKVVPTFTYNLDKEILVAMDTAEKAARHYAEQEINIWIQELMRRSEVFIDDYFKFTNVKGREAIAVYHYIANKIISGHPTAAEAYMRALEKEISAHVIMPEVAQQRVEAITNNTVAAYMKALENQFKEIQEKHNIPTPVWNKHISRLCGLTAEFETKSVPISAKMVLASLGVLTFKAVTPVITKVGQKVGKKMAAKAGAKAAGATGAKSLGKFVPGIGMGIAIVVIVWDLWDYRKTADKGKRELKAGFNEYFQGLKNELLGPTEDSIMGSIVMWENAIRANL